MCVGVVPDANRVGRVARLHGVYPVFGFGPPLEERLAGRTVHPLDGEEGQLALVGFESGFRARFGSFLADFLPNGLGLTFVEVAERALDLQTATTAERTFDGRIGHR